MIQLPPARLPILVNVDEISTHREQLIAIKPGPVDPALVEEARASGVRQLPVLTEDGDLAGLIPVRKLGELLTTGEEISVAKAEIRVPVVPDEVELSEFVQMMIDHNAVIHRSEDGSHPASWFGLVTLADLNRPMFRAYVYRLVVAVETSLGNVIMSEFNDDWGAIRLLSDNTQGRIRDYYNEEKEQGVELSPVMTATLSDLLFIARESNNVWKSLGYANPKEMVPVSQQINELRNRIMHPIRPLIVAEADLEELRTGIAAMLDLTMRCLELGEAPVR